MFYHFKETKVINFWPLISDAIATSTITLIVWNVMIWVGAPIRFLASRLLYHSYWQVFDSKFEKSPAKHRIPVKLLIMLTHQINNFEILFLLLLSSVPVNAQNGKFFVFIKPNYISNYL